MGGVPEVEEVDFLQNLADFITEAGEDVDLPRGPLMVQRLMRIQASLYLLCVCPHLCMLLKYKQ